MACLAPGTTAVGRVASAIRHGALSNHGGAAYVLQYWLHGLAGVGGRRHGEEDFVGAVEPLAAELRVFGAPEPGNLCDVLTEGIPPHALDSSTWLHWRGVGLRTHAHEHAPGW